MLTHVYHYYILNNGGDDILKKKILLVVCICIIIISYKTYITDIEVEPSHNNHSYIAEENTLQSNLFNNLTSLEPLSKEQLKELEQSNKFNQIASRGYTEDKQDNKEEVMLLARLIQSEALGESYEGKMSVGAVVLNRMKLRKQSMREVIYSKKQFSGVGSELFNREPSKRCIQASKDALDGQDPTRGATYFINKADYNPDWIKKLTFIKRIGNHWFYK